MYRKNIDQLTDIDFSDLNTKIKSVSLIIFKYWLQTNIPGPNPFLKNHLSRRSSSAKTDFFTSNTKGTYISSKHEYPWVSLGIDEYPKVAFQELLDDHRNAITKAMIFLNNELTHIPGRELVTQVSLLGTIFR